ncbi:hypothetical protein [Sphingomonas sp.]
MSPVAAKTVYVRADKLIDPEMGVVLTDRMIRIENGRVMAVTRAIAR